MSVVIKGINKPKNCDYCQFCSEEDIMFETVYQCSITGLYLNEDHCFPDICPIIELPEHHGRLFDQDDVKAVLYDMPDTKDKWDAIALLEWAIDKRWCIEAEGADE